MNLLEQTYEKVLEESHKDENVIGLLLGGSRGKDFAFVTEHSDIDVYVILTDDAPPEVEQHFTSYVTIDFEIRVFRLRAFKEYAEWGTDHEWDRYNFAHNTPIIDKTGVIAPLVKQKGLLPKAQQYAVVSEAIESYINQVYRAYKYTRDERHFAAHLDAAESLPLLLIALYGIEGRLRPYNKYFEWELIRYPLQYLPWPADTFVADYKRIIETGDWDTQAKLFKEAKKVFVEHGFAKIVDEWKGYEFVGK